MDSAKSSNPKTSAGNVILFKSPIWDHFKLCEDRKMAECQKCGEQITRCGQAAKRPRLDNLRKHLLNVHDIDIPAVVGKLTVNQLLNENRQESITFQNVNYFNFFIVSNMLDSDFH